MQEQFDTYCMISWSRKYGFVSQLLSDKWFHNLSLAIVLVVLHLKPMVTVYFQVTFFSFQFSYFFSFISKTKTKTKQNKNKTKQKQNKTKIKTKRAGMFWVSECLMLLLISSQNL